MATSDDLRSIALSMPGVAEYAHFDRRAFKARVTFATLAPEAFEPIANAWGRQGWTRVTLAALDDRELRAALEMAWEHARPKARRR